MRLKSELLTVNEVKNTMNEKKMRIYSENNNTIIEGVADFDLEQTLECGHVVVA